MRDDDGVGGPLPSSMAWLSEGEEDRIVAGLRRRLVVNSPGADVIDLASNDYLGLARDPRLIAAGQRAAERWGAGATGSRLVTGTTTLHLEFERDLADFVGFEAGLSFSSGYLANIGVITALADRNTVIVCDTQNHASLIDAVRLTHSEIIVTEHCDIGAVADALEHATRSGKRAIVVTDAVFSVDGDLAPLARLYALTHHNEALLIVDEAHSVGVVGPGGAGACAAAGIAGEPDVIATVTLSKSFGSQGGAVLGHQAVIAHLVDTARTFIFDTGLAPSSVGAASRALEIMKAEPELVARVGSRARDLAKAGANGGWQVSTPAGAVVSIMVGQPQRAVEAAAICADLGVRVGCFRPPSVPDNISRLRLTARATLTDEQIGKAEATFAAAFGGTS